MKYLQYLPPIVIVPLVIVGVPLILLVALLTPLKWNFLFAREESGT